MAKFKTLGIKLLHANVQCVCIVYEKYQKASVKALVQVDFPVHALSEHNKILFKKQSVKKMAKFKTLGIKILHTIVHCVCIVYVKYQKASVKALVQVDFPVHALSEHYKILFKKQSVKKMAKFKMLGIKLLHANVQCVCIVYVKYQKVSVKALVQVDFPVHALSEHYKILFKRQSVKKMAKFKTLGIKLLHANVQCVCIVYVKYQKASVKAPVQADFPTHALSEH